MYSISTEIVTVLTDNSKVFGRAVLLIRRALTHTIISRK